MMNFLHLIDWLPAYFKSQDSYKDSQGKGILERYLEVCGEYFQNTNYTEINNLLDHALNPDTNHPIFINYMWEFLGCMPYAYGALNDGTLWEKYKDPTITREQWESISNDIKPRAHFRDLLKYTLTLYKMRGTAIFYEILGRFYDLQITVSDPGGDYHNPNGNLSGYSIVPNYDKSDIHQSGYDYYYDSTTSSGDTVVYDELLSCQVCVPVTMYIGVDEDLRNDYPFQKRVCDLLNRFRPIHVGEFKPALPNNNGTVYFTSKNPGFEYTFNFKMD